MAEFIIRVVDKGAALDCSKRGDVISVCPDGWGWSQIELTADFWRIVSVLNVPQSVIDTALASAPAEAVIPIGQRKRRDWFIDFSLLPDPSLFSGPRTQAIISITRQQAAAALVKKP